MKEGYTADSILARLKRDDEGGNRRDTTVKHRDEADGILARLKRDDDALVDACKWADSLEEAADELVVTDDMVRARLHTLTKDETKRFDREVGRGYAARLRGKPMKRTPRLHDRPDRRRLHRPDPR